MARTFILLCFALFVAVANSQQRNSNTTPVPILRQINTHNDDGSYTYGYEAADGSYKVETKSAAGDVKGKYGYYDDAGQLREIEYGATKEGFKPSGAGINPPVAAPAQLSARSLNSQQNYNSDDGDDGSYHPSKYETPYEYREEGTQQQFTQPQQQFSNFNQQPQQQFSNFNQQPQQFSNGNQQPQYQQNVQPYAQHTQQVPRPRTTYSQPATHQQPAQNLFQGHPASNFNLNSGSYSINY